MGHFKIFALSDKNSKNDATKSLSSSIFSIDFCYHSLNKRNNCKMTKRRSIPTKKLGSKRIDLPLPKKKEYLRRIVTLKQPYKVVKKIYLEEFKKDLPYSTCAKWRDTGAAILDPEFQGVNCRASFKKSDTIDRFDREKRSRS